MNTLMKVLLIWLCMALPLNSFAMSHDKKKHDGMEMAGDHKSSEMKELDHDGDGNHMKGMDHDSMKMGGVEIPLGEVEVDGVLAKAYLLDVREAMAKHGMKTTHHLMVRFSEAGSGKVLSTGRAAVKIQKGEEEESKAHKMMAMDEAFGADLRLAQDGHYRFRIGTRLDGKKRSFEFSSGMISHK